MSSVCAVNFVLFGFCCSRYYYTIFFVLLFLHAASHKLSRVCSRFLYAEILNVAVTKQFVIRFVRIFFFVLCLLIHLWVGYHGYSFYLFNYLIHVYVLFSLSHCTRGLKSRQICEMLSQRLNRFYSNILVFFFVVAGGIPCFMDFVLFPTDDWIYIFIQENEKKNIEYARPYEKLNVHVKMR